MKENKIKSLENLKGKKVFLTSNGNTIIAHFLWTKNEKELYEMCGVAA